MRTIYSFPLSNAWFYDSPLFAVEKVMIKNNMSTVLLNRKMSGQEKLQFFF